MRILIVDDHNLFLQGIFTLLSTHLKDVKLDVYTSIQKVYQVALSESVDLVLSDIHMPNYLGKNLLELFSENKIFVPVLLVSATEDLGLVRHYLDLGASGFVHKSSNSDELLEAITAVVESGTYLNKRLGERLNQLRSDEKRYLSKRQQQVLKLLGEGLSNKGIGRDLGVAEATIKAHVSALFDFFDANNRVDCIRKAEKLGLL